MNFKTTGLVTLCLVLAVPALGQGPWPRRGDAPLDGPGERPNGEGHDPLSRFSEALDLTPAQLASLAELAEEHQAALESSRALMMSTRETLQAALESGDPTQIGNAMLAQREVREQQRQMHEEFMGQFRNLLTLDQQETLDALESFRGERGFGPRRGGRGGSFPPTPPGR
jgi:Spy/CpxP family protein refolding chaperone